MKKLFSSNLILAILRIGLGFIFMWAFLDKTFGLGFATKATGAWIRGGSPTTGFLSNAVSGPFNDVFKALSGVAVVDWLFMAGLLFVGLTLITNKFVRWGSIAGIIMLALMYLAQLWPVNNPVIDDHIIYALVLAYFAFRKESEN